jgi:benzoate membrane transport protein
MSVEVSGGRMGETARSLLRRSGLNPANASAGVTCGLWYVFGGLPIFLSVAAALHLSPDQTSSWLLITCLTGAISGLALSLRYRQPLAITMTIPGWVLLATVGPRFAFAEIVGANLVAGALILAMGMLGVGERVMKWLPLPIVMGMFAGSILGYASGIFTQMGIQPLIVGLPVAAFVLARAVRRSWLPPMAAAVVVGLAGAALLGQVNLQALTWRPPVVKVAGPRFSLDAVLELAVPLAVMAIGIGNVQGLGLLISKGYQPPIKLATIVIGVSSVINAVFGGHQATIARNGVAILAADDAGPVEQRYVANVVATLFLLLLVVCAATASSVLRVVPVGLVTTLAGLAILSALLDALQRTVSGQLPFGALFALIIAASPLQFFGIGSAFWALIGGLLASLVVERDQLLAALRHQTTPDH